MYVEKRKSTYLFLKNLFEKWYPFIKDDNPNSSNRIVSPSDVILRGLQIPGFVQFLNLPANRNIKNCCNQW
jgi:hypothetical protein